MFDPLTGEKLPDEPNVATPPAPAPAKAPRKAAFSEDVLNAIGELLPELSRSAAKELRKLLGLEDAFLAESIDDSVNPEDGLKSVTKSDIATQLKALGYQVELPGMVTPKEPVVSNPPYGTRKPDDGKPKEDNHMKAVHMARFTDASAARKAIYQGVIGDNYAEEIFNQEVAFAKAMRFGKDGLSKEEVKSLKSQIFPLNDIYNAVMVEGMSTAQMKATQVEAQGELGGFAVPPMHQTDISKRLPGLTAVRGGGARVVTLLSTNSIEIPQYRGSDNNYIGLLRGTWGAEAAAPAAQNFKLDLVQVLANLYTYKVPMSMSVVEDAANLVSMLMNDIVSTVAIDEDYAFLTADDVGKPAGILPGDANGNSLTEVLTGSSGVVTAAGIKKLKRGVASQYRKTAKWIANSDTWADVEALTAGAGTDNWAFPDLSETDQLLGREALESEGLPDVASNSYPILFGDLAGYTIVERLGMAIERFHDSGTGINKVEYHVRKRVGGILEKPWMFAVQKVTA